MPTECDDDLVERLTTFYFRERLSLLKCVHQLFVRAIDAQEDHLSAPVRASLERLLRDGLEENLVASLCAHARGESPARPGDLPPFLAREWARQSLEELKLMLECVFLMYYARTPARREDSRSRGARVCGRSALGRAPAASAERLGRAQPTVGGDKAEAQATAHVVATADSLRALCVVILVEALDLEGAADRCSSRSPKERRELRRRRRVGFGAGVLDEVAMALEGGPPTSFVPRRRASGTPPRAPSAAEAAEDARWARPSCRGWPAGGERRRAVTRKRGQGAGRPRAARSLRLDFLRSGAGAARSTATRSALEETLSRRPSPRSTTRRDEFVDASERGRLFRASRGAPPPCRSPTSRASAFVREAARAAGPEAKPPSAVGAKGTDGEQREWLRRATPAPPRGRARGGARACVSLAASGQVAHQPDAGDVESAARDSPWCDGDDDTSPASGRSACEADRGCARRARAGARRYRRRRRPDLARDAAGPERARAPRRRPHPPAALRPPAERSGAPSLGPRHHPSIRARRNRRRRTTTTRRASSASVAYAARRARLRRERTRSSPPVELRILVDGSARSVLFARAALRRGVRNSTRFRARELRAVVRGSCGGGRRRRSLGRRASPHDASNASPPRAAARRRLPSRAARRGRRFRARAGEVPLRRGSRGASSPARAAAPAARFIAAPARVAVAFARALLRARGSASGARVRGAPASGRRAEARARQHAAT